MHIDDAVTVVDLLPKLARLWPLSAAKLACLRVSWNLERGAPVYTAAGRYTSRGWTEWTEGFFYGSCLLQFDAAGDQECLEFGRAKTVSRMRAHLTHSGVHDHGFNNVSTYAALLRLMHEGRIPADDWEKRFYELALCCSGAVQAMRWSDCTDGGFIYSFNGPHSLFADTIRSLRALALAHHLGHVLKGERDERISLLGRAIEHARTTARWNVYYAEGRDIYDLRGRVAHESIFNLNDGRYRCPSSQQGYSPFSTWTRGLAWVMLGYAEQLEYVAVCSDEELEPFGGRSAVQRFMEDAASATCDFYIATTPLDGIPYWDTGAPGLAHLSGYLERPADPFNSLEPVDSSAAAIAAQGLLRFGHYLQSHGDAGQGRRYWQAGLTVLLTLLAEPYLSTCPDHQGLILHSVYHRPRGWDAIPAGHSVPCGEASMWGDYHAREVALYVQRIAQDQPYLTFLPAYSPPQQP
jgi:unsaturated chondroitin disaccharide hydrolase